MNYVYIGRFQPFHNGHKAIVDLTVKLMGPDDTFTVIIGSADQEQTARNPLSAAQRLQMVRSALGEYSFIKMATINDSPYDYSKWVLALARKLDGIIQENYCTYSIDKAKLDNVCFVGMENVDEYSNRMNAQLKVNTKFHRFSENDTATQVHGTVLRDSFCKDNFYEAMSTCVDINTVELLKKNNFKEVLEKANSYAAGYADATGCKYNSCFLTVDNIVTSLDNSVLLICRKDNGKYAIPGGFAEPYMNMRDNALRELNEETGLSLSDLQEQPDNIGVLYDSPFRDPRSSARCNLVSLVYHWKVKDNSVLAKAAAADDAASLVWLSKEECETLPASSFHADHKKILCKELSWDYFRA